MALSLLLLSTFGGPATPAFAAAPFPSPSTADQLACDLSPASNPGDSSNWWAAVPTNATFAGWFWNDILPNNGATACRGDVAQTFWTQAVPGNWAIVGNIGGWPWPTGGYYTQWLWLHAVPDNWAIVGNIGGWPFPTGGYYTQWFWLHAVPDNRALIANIGGWPWPTGGYYTQWLWLHAVPENWAFTGNVGGWPWPTGGYYTQWFWLHAVPDNWASIANVGGWPFASGGYYTQWFWLHTVPDNWDLVGNIGGWPFPTGGYYTQWFWQHAVPDNWASIANIGGWPFASGGYYTQSLWLHAVPESWSRSAGFALGRSPGPAAISDFVQGNQGYYRYWFWEGAVPDNWAFIGNIGGWPWPAGGYYTQWFWLHAGPDSWAATPDMAIGGTGGAGYYDYSFYHFATVRDFAWRNALSINSSAGAGYFDYWYHRDFGQNVAHYQRLLSLAGGYLGNASTFTPVSSWFGPGAQAVVALTFDTEGSEAETCAVTKVLNQQGVTGAFYLVGTTADALTPGWIQCLSGMDIEDHTVDHPGSFELLPQTWMDTLTDPTQISEIRDNVARVRAKIPNALMTSVRTPDCDGNKAFDQSLILNSIASGMESDRSVATITSYARQTGVMPPFGLSLFSLSAFPSPFVVGSASGKQLIEFPFTYPSDWTAAEINGLNSQQAPPVAGDPRYAVTVWEREFDEIYNQHGIMVVLMHPWIQGARGRFPDGLNALINYMKSKPGVVFTTAAAANLQFRAAAGLSPASPAPGG